MANLEKVGTFVLTDDTLDRHSERILAEGVDLKDFKANPIMFYNHMRSGNGFFGAEDGPRPIGIWKNIRRVAGQIKADAWIHTASDYARDIGQLIRDGVIKAASVGIQVLAVSDAEDDKVRGQKGVTITKSKLLECSIVDIPANPAALRVDKIFKNKAADCDVSQDSEAQPQYIIKTAFCEETEKDMNIKDIETRLTNAVKNLFGKEIPDAESALKQLEAADLNDAIAEAVDKYFSENDAEVTELVEVETFKAYKEDTDSKLGNLEKAVADLAETVKELAGAVSEEKTATEDTAKSIQESLSEIAKQVSSLKAGRQVGDAPADAEQLPITGETETSDADEKRKAVVAETMNRLLSGKLTTN